MWNKKVWNSMPNVHKFVKSCEISIDAATRETYETKVRLNGNWDNLISNLKFISTIKGLRLIKPSFVVQQKNYKEMYDFAQLMKSIFGNKVLVLFVKMNNWGTFTDLEFMKEKIWDSSHPEYSEFIIELNRIKGLSNVYHNMHDLLNEDKSII
jgi:MoaA/NifB/PqqE/SkfB family radical SAM enzyme